MTFVVFRPPGTPVVYFDSLNTCCFYVALDTVPITYACDQNREALVSLTRICLKYVDVTDRDVKFVIVEMIKVCSLASYEPCASISSVIHALCVGSFLRFADSRTVYITQQCQCTS